MRIHFIRLALLATAVCMVFASWAIAQEDDLEVLLQRYPVTVEDGRRLVEFSISQILKLVLQRSLSLQATRLGENIAQSGLIAAQERNHPTLTSKVETGRSISLFSSQGFRSDSNTLNAELSKTLANGINISASVSQTQTSSECFAPTSRANCTGFGSSDTQRAGVIAQASIPIFQDFGAINDVPEDSARITLDRSRHATRQFELNLLRTVATTYWDLVGLRETIRVEQEAVELSQQLLQDNKQRLTAGVVSPADVKVSESQLANDRQKLFNVRVEAQRIEDAVRAALNLEGIDLGLKPIEEPTLRDGQFELAPLLEKTFARDPRLADLESALAQNQFDQMEAENADRPDLDLNLQYRLNGFGKSTGEAVSQLSDTDVAGYGVILTWKVPLFDHITPETIRQRQLESTQLELQRANIRSELTVVLQRIQRQIQLAEDEVGTARVSVSLQRELLQNEIERFRLGESTSYRVGEVQQDFSRAREQEILARIRYEKIFLELLLVTGDIYAQYNLPDPNP